MKILNFPNLLSRSYTFHCELVKGNYYLISHWGIAAKSNISLIRIKAWKVLDF